MKLNQLNWSILIVLSGVALLAHVGCDPNQQIIGEGPNGGGSPVAASGAGGSLASSGGASSPGGARAIGGASTVSTCIYQGTTYPVDAQVGLCLCLPNGTIGHCTGALGEVGGAIGAGGTPNQGGASATGGSSHVGGAVSIGGFDTGGASTGGVSTGPTCLYQGTTYPVDAQVGLCLCLPDGTIGHCTGALGGGGGAGGNSSAGSGGTGASGGAVLGAAGSGGDDPRVRSCLDSGGVVAVAQCCANPSVTDFISMCAVGPCGCAPEYSKPILTCQCPETQCFNGSICAPR